MAVSFEYFVYWILRTHNNPKQSIPSETAFHEITHSPPTNRVRIEWSQLADQAIPMGGLALALGDFFALPVLETPIDILSQGS